MTINNKKRGECSSSEEKPKKEKKRKEEKKSKKEKKEKKKSKKKRNLEDDGGFHDKTETAEPGRSHKKHKTSDSEVKRKGSRDRTKRIDDGRKLETTYLVPGRKDISFPIKYILAPMVGASELAFRLLCRKYGAQASYTPMMNSHQFANNAKYREEEFQTIKEDRPLVCHFSSNDPKNFAAAAKLVEDKCDAVDLNLGCPQRTAYLGHFGSYLLEQKDRELICSIVREASQQVSIPIFVKIRLLDTIDETIELCRQLKNAGASLIAIHARYRASFERKGAGARDGPAMLDQVLRVRQALGNDFPLISNGNVITYDDVENNLNFTQANGIMSAEGILDSPALYLPQYGNPDQDGDKLIKIAKPSHIQNENGTQSQTSNNIFKKKRKLTKKLREIEKLESKEKSKKSLSKEEEAKITLKESIQNELYELDHSGKEHKKVLDDSSNLPQYEKVPLRELYKMSNDKLSLALEYLSLVRQYPTKLRTVVFHTRRMLKQALNEYQLMEECINSKSIDEIEAVIKKIRKYQKDPSSFHYDKEKEKREKEALERKRREEGKRKAYEARMIRKAKREGQEDLEYYLRQGAQTPTSIEVKKLRRLSKDEQMQHWKSGNHAQHCLAFHLHEGGCKRDRSCAFLHVDALGENSFQETEEVAG